MSQDMLLKEDNVKNQEKILGNFIAYWLTLYRFGVLNSIPYLIYQSEIQWTHYSVDLTLTINKRSHFVTWTLAFATSWRLQPND